MERFGLEGERMMKLGFVVVVLPLLMLAARVWMEEERERESMGSWRLRGGLLVGCAEDAGGLVRDG